MKKEVLFLFVSEKRRPDYITKKLGLKKEDVEKYLTEEFIYLQELVMTMLLN